MKIIAVIFGGSLFCAGQTAATDYHLTRDPNRQLYLRSAFAHGHEHGYEEGFHAGDEDYHLRHAAWRGHKYPKSTGYDAAFGDRKSYMQGFESGFRVGYSDSYSGRAFHEWRRLEIEGAAPAAGNPPSGNSFDAGVEQGYRAGFLNSDTIADEPGIVESATWRCKQEQQSRPLFCSGFGAGYALGRADQAAIAGLEKSHPARMAQSTP